MSCFFFVVRKKTKYMQRARNVNLDELRRHPRAEYWVWVTHVWTLSYFFITCVRHLVVKKIFGRSIGSMWVYTGFLLFLLCTHILRVPLAGLLCSSSDDRARALWPEPKKPASPVYLYVQNGSGSSSMGAGALLHQRLSGVAPSARMLILLAEPHQTFELSISSDEFCASFQYRETYGFNRNAEE